MNLLDMLSNESLGTMYQDSMDGVLGEREQRLFYLPTLLCPIQKELSALLVLIFTNKLLEERRAQRLRTSINVLLESSDDLNSQAVFEVVTLIFEQLRVISRHPALLVDHFIPKKFLLLQTNERMVNLSGNFQLFNRLVDAVVTKKEPFVLLVVAADIKEIELVEGLIIGKNLSYRNMCSSKLYEDDRVCDSHVVINLVTTHHLYNNYVALQNRTGSPSYSAVFSFDTGLDLSAPSTELLMQANPKMPVLVPIALDSIEHLILKNPNRHTTFYALNDVSSPDFKWKLQCIHDVIMIDTPHTSPTFFLDTYGRNMHKLETWLRTGDGSQWAADLLSMFPARPQYSGDALDKRLLSLAQEKDVDIRGYKHEMTMRALARLEDLEAEIAQIYIEKLVPARMAETKRQLKYDDDEDHIATNYHKLRRLNEDAAFIENKFSRADADVNRQTQKKNDLLDKLAFVRNASNPGHNIDISKQKETLKALRDELAVLTNEYEVMEGGNNELRQKYQLSLADAIKLQGTLDKVQESNSKLQHKLEGPGMRSLPALIRKDALMDLEGELSVARNNNAFLSLFLKDKLEKVSKERHSVMEATQSGSNSRPSNRISRAATPM